MALRLPARVDCENDPSLCGQTFEAVWEDDSMTIEDMAEAPVADIKCPNCGHVHKDFEWPGWTFRSEAG